MTATEPFASSPATAPPQRDAITPADYAALAGFRYQLRVFLHNIYAASEANGLTPQQHQALLAIRGRSAPGATIGWIGEQLLIQPNSASELVSRLEALGYVRRTTPDDDRRRAVLTLTPEGCEVLERITASHKELVVKLKPMLFQLLQSLD
ncbi:MAG: MarR family winged helix-turn-helix transcriptional regulator [Sphingomonadaceae bacterium]|nr:MarR family winged helix-turn-helix transcriptional regulator [Sphingomonadaceae bacterium]